MGAQAKPSSNSNSMQRVKVYRLNDDGKWDDQGTGHVTVDYMERSEDLGLIVIDEEDNDTLLVHRISSDEIYRRQEDTIISWRDPELSTELALSFQEPTCCSYIWDQVFSIQRNLQFNSLGNLDVVPRPAIEDYAAGISHSNDESFRAAHSDLRDLPSVELSTLPLILKILVPNPVLTHFFDPTDANDCAGKWGCGSNTSGGINTTRSTLRRVLGIVIQLFMRQDFFPKLVDIFRMSEDIENMDGLYMIYKLVKGIILLNSQQIFDKIFGDEFILDIIGCLEYDPEASQVQLHRAFLKDHVIFKEAIPIKDPSVLSKIHQTYRIGYIKDVILPRVLDEATMASLNSIIHGNNVVVISLLKDDSSFIHELFARMRAASTSVESKRNLILFLHEFCALSKSLQLVQQLRLFRDLASEGLFDIITDALHSQDQKLVSTGTDILILFLNQDPNLLRSYIIQQEGHTLLQQLVKGMITDFGEDMHCQFLEIIRILLDSYPLSGSQVVSQRDAIIEIFYAKHLDQLIDVITLSCSLRSKSLTIPRSQSGGTTEPHVAAKPEILLNICELLCFCVLHHPYRIKCNFLMNNAIEKVTLLTRRREKYLVVAAVRFMRTIISRNDEHLLRHITKNNLLKPVIEAFIENGNRYNMLHSGILELLEYIRKENLKILIVHVVDCFWDQLHKFENLSTIQALKVKYEQSLEKCNTQNTINVVDPRKRIEERALEKEEEDYFNEDSDEEDSASAHSSHRRNQRAQPSLSNGTSASHSSPTFRSGSGGLVDYEDDEDDEYNPPPRKPETTTEDDKPLVSSIAKHKLVSISNSKADEPELKKKRRLEQHLNDDKLDPLVVRSACSSRDTQGEKELVPSSPQTTDPKIVSDDCKRKEESAGPNCLSCTSTPEAADIRQSAGEDHPLTQISNSSPELVVNKANSEPYSVR